MSVGPPPGHGHGPPGQLIAIAWRGARRMPMLQADSVVVVAGGGIEGDHKGVRFPRRGVTILAREDWQAALRSLTQATCDAAVPTNKQALPWTLRRANLLTDGVTLPRAKGAIVHVGTVVLDVTGQTWPCRRMDEACPGLLKALAPDWRGGLTCEVVEGGRIAVGDEIRIAFSPGPQRQGRLPG